ncbi:MAG: hypothetical protein AAFX39_03050 [Pseudomonadota bacterium]
MTTLLRAFTLVIPCALLLGLISGITPTAAEARSVAEIATQTRSTLADTLPAETKGVVDEALAAYPDAVSAEGIGHALLMNRHLDAATYAFATSVEADASRGSALTALGVSLIERALASGTADEAVLEDAVALHREAAATLPDEAFILNNLGTALLRLAQQRDNDPALLADAIAVLSQAADSMEPPSALFYTRLAEALEASGDADGAAAALTEAFLIDSTNYALITYRDSAQGGAIPVSPPACNVNFDCANTCPGGIIGGVKRVTCEIEQSSQQLACMEGRPYTTSYNCDIEFPKFGIVIPGLYPGFSILTPFGSIDVIVQGGGNIDYRVKVNTPQMSGFQVFAEAQGRYNAHSGENRWDLGGGLQYSVGNGNPVMRAVNDYDLGLSGVIGASPDQTDQSRIRIDAVRGILVSH